MAGQRGGHLFPAPDCLKCQTTTIPAIIAQSNPNGNAGRPYYKCPRCPTKSSFCTFADDRNVHSLNPHCWCPKETSNGEYTYEYSRGELTSVEKGQKLFYKCWNMNCQFWKWADEQTTDSDASSVPPKAQTDEDLSQMKVKTSDAYRSPAAVEAESSYVFQSSSPVKTEPSKELPSPVEVKCSEVSLSPKKEPSPPPVQHDITEGLARVTLNSSPTPEPKKSRFRCVRRWIRRLKA